MSFNAGDSRSISIGQPVRPTRRSEDSSINDQICAHLISTFVSMAITNEFLSLVRSILPFICLLGSAPTFFIFWLPLRLSSLIFFSQRIYRRYDDFLYSMYQRTVLFFFEHWTKTKIYFHGDAKRIFVKKENVLYLSNHQSSVDWIIANMLAVRQGSLGHIRYILKNDLKWIPLYGFYFREHGCIYVNRHDKKDLERVERGIRQVKSNGLPVWLVIFPEGTRYNSIQNPSALGRSKTFAEQKGVRPFEHVLYPRSGATVASINALKDQFDAIYDITVIYGRTNDQKRQLRLAAPSMAEFFKRSQQEIHIHLERIPIDSVPKATNEEISTWLYQRFEKKDALLNEFYESSSSEEKFAAETNVDELKLSETLPSLFLFVFTTFCLLLSPTGRMIYFLICVFGSLLGFAWIHFFPTRR